MDKVITAVLIIGVVSAVLLVLTLSGALALGTIYAVESGSTLMVLLMLMMDSLAVLAITLTIVENI